MPDVQVLPAKILLFFVLCYIVVGDQINDYPQISRPEMKRSVHGKNVRLACPLVPCSTIKWEFQPCGSGQFRSKCIVETDSWRALSLEENIPCPYLLLREVTLEHNGLYKCSHIGSADREIKIYQLDVIKKIAYDQGTPPELLEVFPVNSSIIQTSRLVIQCKVFSKTIPTILWFKELSVPIRGVSIEYKNRTYMRLNGSPQFKLDDVYLSKLIIENTSDSDSGVYKCLALNIFGKTDKNVHVTVTTVSNWEETTSFSLLFLIPLGLAMFPVAIWTCYYKKYLKYKPMLDRSKV